jgi:hypothetical protein
MIIPSHRAAKHDPMRTVTPHALHGPEKDSVAALAGNLQHLKECAEAAEASGVKYAARHWKLSPQIAITDDVALAIVKLLQQDLLPELEAEDQIR